MLWQLGSAIIYAKAVQLIKQLGSAHYCAHIYSRHHIVFIKPRNWFRRYNFDETSFSRVGHGGGRNVSHIKCN